MVSRTEIMIVVREVSGKRAARLSREKTMG